MSEKKPMSIFQYKQEKTAARRAEILAERNKHIAKITEVEADTPTEEEETAKELEEKRAVELKLAEARRALKEAQEKAALAAAEREKAKAAKAATSAAKPKPAALPKR